VPIFPGINVYHFPPNQNFVNVLAPRASEFFSSRLCTNWSRFWNSKWLLRQQRHSRWVKYTQHLPKQNIQTVRRTFSIVLLTQHLHYFHLTSPIQSVAYNTATWIFYFPMKKINALNLQYILLTGILWKLLQEAGRICTMKSVFNAAQPFDQELWSISSSLHH